MNLRSLALLVVAVALVLAGCAKKYDPNARPKLNLKPPEIDASEVAEYVEIATNEVVPDAAGTMGQLKLTLTVKQDFGGKVLVLEAYDGKGEGAMNVGRIPLPPAEGGTISATIDSIEMWHQTGRGVLRLVEEPG